jgi:hypothetical protein
MLRVFTLLLSLFAMFSGPALSETYYVVPPSAVVSGTPDGTETMPFLSIDAAFASGKVKGGDTLLLKDGAYGTVTIKANATFDVPVTIMSQNAKAAQFDSVLLAQTTRNLVLSNLSIWPSDPAKGAAYLIRSYDTTSDITLAGLDIRSEQGAAAYMKWDAAKWAARKFSGVFLEGPRSVVSGSKLTGVYHGIMVADDSQIINNVVEGFNGDGMRAFSRSTVRNNRVLNCVATDENHDDGFQSFQSDGVPVTDLVVDSNVIIEWAGPKDHPLRCSLQGIGLFDGPYDNLTVVNNLISISAYHGISAYGSRGARIINNTVVNIRGLVGTAPWIGIYPRKDGTPSTDVLVANNVAMSLQGTASTVDRVEFRNNSVIGTPSAVFENPAAFDYRPKASSGYIDAADPTVAPAKDVMGQTRPSGKNPDLGAYEVRVKGASASTAVLITQSPGVTEAPVTSPTKPAGTTTSNSAGGSKRIVVTKMTQGNSP